MQDIPHQHIMESMPIAYLAAAATVTLYFYASLVVGVAYYSRMSAFGQARHAMSKCLVILSFIHSPSPKCSLWNP